MFTGVFFHFSLSFISFWSLYQHWFVCTCVTSKIKNKFLFFYAYRRFPSFSFFNFVSVALALSTHLVILLRK